MPSRSITLRGVEVHNLKHIDLDLPHRKLIVFCGVSGSGKSSLAFDTLYAEGQRRFIESFSAYTRQFLERLEKPAAERIDGIPPAVAVARGNVGRSGRSTVGTSTETNDYLRLLFAKIGRTYCRQCGREVRRDSPQSVVDTLAALPSGTRYLVTFPCQAPPPGQWPQFVAGLREDGFVRLIDDARQLHLDDAPAAEVCAPGMEPAGGTPQIPDLQPPTSNRQPPTSHLPSAIPESQRCTNDAQPPSGGRLYVVVDRLSAGVGSERRLHDSVELAFAKGDGRCSVFVDANTHTDDTAPPLQGIHYLLDGRPWRQTAWSTRLACDDCHLEYPAPEPRLYSFNSPLGACPRCEGFGNIIDVDMDLVVPDPIKTLREGAIAPWTTPAYAHELKELLTLADDYDLPVDVPFRELNADQRRLVVEGVPEREFGGLNGFFAWLQRRKYKMHIRVFLSRWRRHRPCPACGGARLRAEALATRVGGKNLAEISAMKIRDAAGFFHRLELTDWERHVGRVMLDQVRSRLGYLESVGLGYLTLDRALRTLSGGESQRVALTSALGSSLVNMLYVLDEPSVGLHPHDTDRLLQAILGLRDRG
ncbi:MAG TPA: excinuclease ABC subunit A, partial [Pirellulales bacterium]|nr:excinuclease ABC subunit A [Pirellulales bacterium]